MAIEMTKPSLHEITLARDLARSGAGRAIRKHARLSHREVAQVVGASASSVYRWETGERVPRSAAGLRWAAQMRRLLDES
jgi:DNA-binding transcriptional regulator YiaG